MVETQKPSNTVTAAKIADILHALTTSFSTLSIAGSKTSTPSFVIPTLPSSTTSTKKAKNQREIHKTKERRNKARKENQARDVVTEFEVYFGSDVMLENWQRLCKDVGVEEEELGSITQCKKALKGVWVNIYDLLDAAKAEKCPPRRFPSEQALSNYTKRTKRVYPKNKAKAEGPVRALLAHIFGY